MFLSEDFLEKYKNKSPSFGGNGLGEFIYYRTYSRWLEEQGRREKWWETVKRSVEYSFSLYRGNSDFETLSKEAEELYDAIFNLKIFPAGRTLWIANTKAASISPMANINCSAIIVDSIESFIDLFYLLLVGAGVGFRVLKSDVSKLPKFNKKIVLANKPFYAKQVHKRKESTEVYREDGTISIYVGDSKKGWVDALNIYLNNMSDRTVEAIIINYDSVRPAGELLKTFGGRASGHQALRDMFKNIHKVIQSSNGNLTPLQCMDICNIIGYYVVVGGVRRTSEMCIFDKGDDDIMHAKIGIMDSNSANYNKFTRFMSNNSIAFYERPSKEELRKVFLSVKESGEPGIINMESIKRRRKDGELLNPCGEIILRDNGTCNLAELNINSFISEDGKVDLRGLAKAVSLYVRHNMRMTNLDFELNHWDEVQKVDRLTGSSICGWMDFVDKLYINDKSQRDLLHAIHKQIHKEVDDYAYEMRIPKPLLVTTIKPGGTVPLLPTVSSGVHRSFAPFYIRRVRVSSSDPIARAAIVKGYRVYPETGQGPGVEEFDRLSEYDKVGILEKADTWVIEFPVKSATKVKAYDESAVEQLKRYIMFQQCWTDHNTSITVYVGEDEWEDLVNFVYDNWDDYVAVSFLPKDGNIYPLMPMEEITEEKYYELVSRIKSDVDLFSILLDIEKKESAAEIIDTDCSTGACPIR